jgi:hypothetical protein
MKNSTFIAFLLKKLYFFAKLQIFGTIFFEKFFDLEKNKTIGGCNWGVLHTILHDATFQVRICPQGQPDAFIYIYFVTYALKTKCSC